MNIEIEAMALEMPEVAGHPNRLAFHGVLTLVGIASRRAPSGARGHRVMLTRKATEMALPSLLGMAVDYAPALDAHDARRKIGVITEAEIVPLHPNPRNSGVDCEPRLKAAGNKRPQGLHHRSVRAGNGTPRLRSGQALKAVPLQNTAGTRVDQQPGEPGYAQEVAGPRADSSGQIAISGYLYAHDFPDVVGELRAGHGELGMSYEIADAFVVSPASPVWTVTSFTFTGAAVLRREKAAYPETWMAIG